MSMPEWNKFSWRDFNAAQQPAWPDMAAYENALKELSELPALVYAGETRRLRQQLADAALGKTFVLQCGDCSEDFSRCNGPRIHALVKVILQMSLILSYAGEKKVVNIGRIAGQYAKPRSSETEIINNEEIMSYRGDMVNSPNPSPEARTPNPRRILEGYFRAAATLNLVRAFTRGGYAALDFAEAWHRDFIGAFPVNRKYEELVRGIRKAVNYSKAVGLDIDSPQLNQIILYTSHEALLLGYEEALTRIDTTTGDWYDTSAHMLWIGERTRQPGGAHVEFLRGVNNPVGIKIGPGYALDDVKRVIQKLNSSNIQGRITLITRFGAEKIDSALPPLLLGIKNEGFNVTWLCDPMHGNTYTNELGIKTRRFDDILKETGLFFSVCRAHGTVVGGVHLELTGDNVTECLGGQHEIADSDLRDNYLTSCDPRLNAEQSIELAFKMSEMMNPDLSTADNSDK